MRATSGLFPALLLPALLSGPSCGLFSQTPPEVARAYAQLLGGLDPARPGSAVARLQEFGRRNRAYSIAATVDKDLGPWKGQLEPAYRRARDLTREGRFDEAQAILVDLAQLPEEPAGRMAQQFLSFEFHQLKASQLLLKGDTAGARAAATELRNLPLDETKRPEAESLLDSVGMVDSAVRMTRTTAFQSAARSIHVALISSFMDEGRYPETFNLDSPVLANLRNTGLLRTVSTVTDYVVKGDEFSLIVTGQNGERMRITNTGVDPLP
jgi:hypothetical protein